MIYIGHKTWIEADPMTLTVIKVTIPSAISWFKVPAQIVRWKRL